MRKWFLAVLFVAVFVVSTCPVQQTLAQQRHESSDLFSQLGQLDGAYAEGRGHELALWFERDPALARESDTTVEIVASMIAGDAWRLEDHVERVETLALSGLFAGEQLRVLNVLRDGAMLMLDRRRQSASEATKPADPVVHPVFDRDTIIQHIRVRLAPGVDMESDEDFGDFMAALYCAAPQELAEAVSVPSREELTQLSRSVARGMVRSGFEGSGGGSAVAEGRDSFFVRSVADQVNRLRLEREERGSPARGDAGALSMEVPTIGPKTWNSSPLIVGDLETLKVRLTETTRTDIKRTYWVEVYAERETVPKLWQARTVEIPSGQTYKDTLFSSSFMTTGVHQMRVKVFSHQGGTLLNQTPYAADTVRGYWKITVGLRVNRTYKGQLRLFAASGLFQFGFDCLGQSQ